MKYKSEREYYEEILQNLKEFHDSDWSQLADDSFAFSVGPVGLGLDQGDLASRKILFLGEIAFRAHEMPSDEELKKIREEAAKKVLKEKGDGVLIEWDMNWESTKIVQAICQKMASPKADAVAPKKPSRK